MASDLPVPIVYRGHFQTQYQTNHIIILCNRVDRRLRSCDPRREQSQHVTLLRVDLWPGSRTPSSNEIRSVGDTKPLNLTRNQAVLLPFLFFPEKKERKRLIAGN